MIQQKKIMGLQKAKNTLRLIHLNEELSLLPEYKMLLEAYGKYMFDELGLVAGKENLLRDIENFPLQTYSSPQGTFVLAKIENAIIGCAGIKYFDQNSCELKRMYVIPAYREKGIGKILCNFLIEWCREMAIYKRVLLDTNSEMKEALSLYQKCGFKEIQRYCINENSNPVFMEYVL